MNDFPDIPLLEHRPYDRIRELYLFQEPILLGAVRRSDRGKARRIINHALVHIYSAGEERSDLLKGLLLELVVMVSLEISTKAPRYKSNAPASKTQRTGWV